eukprot:m.310664 g.310664  ORF g.310664 m.310664 type:complete len:207 (+) comp53618_c0_seq1:65-685(+)
MANFPYRLMLKKVGEELSDEQVASLKLLCKDEIPPGKAETITTGQQLFTALEEAGYISSANLTFMKTILEEYRVDLIRKVEEYEEQFGKPGAKLPKGLEGKVLTAELASEIGSQLSRDWRTLARRLKVSNDEILNVASDHRDSLQEQGIQMVLRWYKTMPAGKQEVVDVIRGQQAAEVLDAALRSAGLTSIADKHFGRVFEEARHT